MKAKSPPTLSVVLAIQCGIWVAFAPVLSEMHQAVADHHHVFCADHNRVEDVAERSNDLATALEGVEARPEMRIGVCACSVTGNRSQMECVFSNFSVHACSKAPAQVPRRHSSETRAAPRLLDVNFRIANTLDVAPKNSPPVAS